MGVQSLVISLCRYIVVIMPLAWLFCRLLGADGIWNTLWVTEVITAGISMVVYHKSVKLRINQQEPDHSRSGSCFI